MNWEWVDFSQLERFIKEEKKTGNMLANMIHKINLEKSIIMVILDPGDDEEFDNQFSGENQAMTVEIDIRINAQMNVQRYHQIKKKSAIKEVKTIKKAEEAIKKANQVADKDLQKVQASSQRFDQVRK